MFPCHVALTPLWSTARSHAHAHAHVYTRSTGVNSHLFAVSVVAFSLACKHTHLFMFPTTLMADVNLHKHTQKPSVKTCNVQPLLNTHELSLVHVERPMKKDDQLLLTFLLFCCRVKHQCSSHSKHPVVKQQMCLLLWAWWTLNRLKLWNRGRCRPAVVASKHTETNLHVM